MANEIKIAVSASYSKNAITATYSKPSYQCSVTGITLEAQVAYSAPTVDTALPLGGVTAPRWLWIENLSATNYVDVKDAVGGNVIAHLLPGDFALIPLPTTCVAPSTQANTAACSVKYFVFPI